jgi:hypothetical protein
MALRMSRVERKQINELSDYQPNGATSGIAHLLYFNLVSKRW